VSASSSFVQPIYLAPTPKEGHQNDTNGSARVTSGNDLTKISIDETASLFAGYIHLICRRGGSGDSVGGIHCLSILLTR
jgi:hypothetical protein